MKIDLPGERSVQIEHLVLDYNGTLAVDGRLIPGVRELLRSLSSRVKISVLTADTFGTAAEDLREINCILVVLPKGKQDILKLNHVKKLGTDRTVCIGNGRNDLLMLREAVLGIAVLQEEGASVQTVLNADVASNSITDALQLLTEPKRLVATLRNA